MAVNVGINGFGRIGRLVLRVMASRPNDFNIVAINDLSDPKSLALLLKYDTMHGRFNGTVEAGDNSLIVNGKTVKILQEKNPANLGWGKLGVDVVVESTGFFTKKAGDGKPGFDDHIKAGAKKVIISAPAKGQDRTIVMGVNDGELKKEDQFISNASCTTNCLAPMVKVLNDKFGIVQGVMTTVHAYTNDQRINDQIHEDMRRARAAAQNIIPSKTGAAQAIGEVLPAMNGLLTGMALRVPVADGSITDLTVEVKKAVKKDEVNAAFKEAAGKDLKEGGLKGILEYSTDPLVSSDIVGNPHSCIFDSLITLVQPGTEGKMVKVLGWYDNEWGYSCRTADLVMKVGEKL
jgi:glyceraldehyde 3-phosphate dehydrogenase